MMGDPETALDRVGGLLHALTIATVGVFVVSLAVPLPDPLVDVRDLVLGNLVFILPAALLFLRAVRKDGDGWWAVSLGLGVTSFLCGNLYYLWTVSRLGEVPFPSWADVGYLGIYPFLILAVVFAIRRHAGRIGQTVAADGIVGALATAAVASWALSPLLHPSGDTAAALASLGYPIGDLLVTTAALGALGVLGARGGGLFLGLATGLVVFAVADSIYTYRVALDSYEVGTWLDALWAIGVTILASTAWWTSPPVRSRVPGPTSLLVAALGSVAGLVVLVAGPPLGAGPLTLALGVLTMLACGFRMVLAFAHLRDFTRLQTQVMTDDLTGVANRRALYRHLDGLFAGPQESADDDRSDPALGLALVDLDRFKEVNDSFGHATGDDLLRAVARRFAATLATFPYDPLLARLGGDEFAIVLHEPEHEEAVLAVVAALQDSLSVPVHLAEAVLHVQASIGVAVAPRHARSRSDLLFAADAAMYAAKASGTSVGVYSPAAAGDRRNRLTLAEELYAALARDELNVVYQPITRENGTLVLAEALVRWDHPTRGRLAPHVFLEIAERRRLTPAITARVLDLALADIARWHARGAHLGCSVNVSASDFQDEHIVDMVANALLTHEVAPHLLTLEITETALMTDPERARVVLGSLHELGVQLAIDDYGTGYSSLEYLLQLPIQMLKLDRAFSVNISTDGRAREIVRSTVQLTHALGLQIVAEGVEDQATLRVLEQLGCDLVQGWRLGRPVPAADFERAHLTFVRDSSGPPAPTQPR